MNADTMLDILTLQEAVKVLKRGNVPVFYDYEPQFPLGAEPNQDAIHWLTAVIEWIKKEEKT